MLLTNRTGVKNTRDLLRAFGGVLYLSGALIMAFNIWQTIAGNLRKEDPLRSAEHDAARDVPLTAVPAE